MTYVLIYFKGLLMGCADLVPGVSGGTVALITGIYQRLINAIAAFNRQTLVHLLKGQFKQAWKQVDGWFLLVLFGGILTAVFTLASGIKYLLLHHPVLTWSFFFGLIISSAFLLVFKNRTNDPFNVLWLALGAFIGYWLSTQQMAILPDGAFGVFLAGFIAITAMILPGISGSLILILLGQYEAILKAVELLDWRLLVIFALGCVLGLLVFSRVLKWLLARFYKATIYTLSGLMLGTLFKVWPWQSAGHNISPTNHPEPLLIWAIMTMVQATILVWVVGRKE